LKNDTMALPSQTRLEHVPPEEAQLVAFKGALLLAVFQLPVEARSLLAHEVEQLGHQFRGLQSAERQHLRRHLKQLAKGVLLAPVLTRVAGTFDHDEKGCFGPAAAANNPRPSARGAAAASPRWVPALASCRDAPAAARSVGSGTLAS
jgi:hypothetical protein